MIEMTGRDAAAAGERHDRHVGRAQHEEPGRAHHVDGVARRERVVHPVRHPPVGDALHRRREAARRRRASSTSSSSGRPSRRRWWPGRCRTARRRRRRSPRAPAGMSRTNDRVSAVSSTTSTTAKGWYSWSGSIGGFPRRPSAVWMITRRSPKVNANVSFFAKATRTRGSRGAQRGHVADDPGHGAGRGAPLRRRRGRGRRRRRRVDFAALAAMVADAARALLASGVAAGRPGRGVGAELARVDRRRARRDDGRRGARPGQHPLPGRRGGLRPRPQRRPRAVHRPRLPRHRLPGAARRRRRAAPGARAHGPPLGRRRRRDRWRGTSSSRAATPCATRTRRRARRVDRPRRPERRRVHVRHDRAARRAW